MATVLLSFSSGVHSGDVDKLLSRFGGFVVMARVKEILELPTFFDGKADVMSRASQYSTRYGSVRAGLGNDSV